MRRVKYLKTRIVIRVSQNISTRMGALTHCMQTPRSFLSSRADLWDIESLRSPAKRYQRSCSRNKCLFENANRGIVVSRMLSKGDRRVRHVGKPFESILSRWEEGGRKEFAPRFSRSSLLIVENACYYSQYAVIPISACSAA